MAVERLQRVQFRMSRTMCAAKGSRALPEPWGTPVLVRRIERLKRANFNTRSCWGMPIIITVAPGACGSGNRADGS